MKLLKAFAVFYAKSSLKVRSPRTNISSSSVIRKAEFKFGYYNKTNVNIRSKMPKPNDDEMIPFLLKNLYNPYPWKDL